MLECFWWKETKNRVDWNKKNVNKNRWKYSKDYRCFVDIRGFGFTTCAVTKLEKSSPKKKPSNLKAHYCNTIYTAGR